MLLVQISDPDIWFHLSIGREIVNSLSIPEREFLVYPNADKPGAFHEWGFGVLHYLSYKLGGYWAMSFLNAFIAALTLLFLYRAARPDRRDVPYFLMALLATFVWMEFRLIYRPEMVLYLSLAVEIYLLERFLSDRDWRRLLPIPVAGFLLSQVHPSAIFLVAVLGVYLLQVVWESRNELRSAGREIAWFGLTAAGTVLLAAVNPYGFQQIILPFDFVQAGRVTMTVDEFQDVLTAGYHWSYFTLAGASGLALVAVRNRRPVDWLFFIVFAYLAFEYVRNIGLFALVMYVPLARGFSDGVRRLRSRLQETGLTINDPWLSVGGWAGAAIALLLVLFTPVVIRPWGAGPTPLMFPETAVRAIREIKPPGRIFNFYDLGGYLGWALGGDYQVFIDGRHYMANRALSLHNAVIVGRHGWERVLDRYDVNTIVTQGTFRTTGKVIPIVGILAGHPDWVLAARGERGLLFLRREIASGLPDRYRLDESEVWKQIIAEADYVLQYRPRTPVAHLSRAEALLALGQRELAIREFERYLAMTPGDSRTKQKLEELKAFR